MPYFISAAIAAVIAILILVLTKVPDDVRRFDTGAKSGVWNDYLVRGEGLSAKISPDVVGQH